MAIIGIFPASGALGTSTYTHLLKLVPGNEVILINRYPQKIPQSHISAGVKVRKASFENSPSELQAAFSGIDTLFLISYPSHVHDYRTKVHLPAVDAAKGAGVKHIFYASLGFGGDYKKSSRAEVMQAHLDTERYLAKLASEDPSFTYTVIREGLYAESTPIYTAFFVPSEPVSEDNGVIQIPHDGSGPGVAWVKRDELGEASARLIAGFHIAAAAGENDQKRWEYVNKTVLLTGPKVWSLAETVAVLSQIAGREVKIKQVSVDEYVKLPKVLDKFGKEELARTWATAWDAIRDGETAVVTGELEKILGRELEAFDVAARKHFGRE
ncbi:uncharacterized protein C8A04DRAFT_32501 [Dichotomopilus funicola]|uniref:NmrA-like domain-containing protein n=1 Tax=Dichotomopilus funicola TaxID=1934379 RepID=A0AAN6ZJC9_9PEZI|nr:hypothetical protein C8A04DRAFT_32501 [Dichotomopilus funicola]